MNNSRFLLWIVMLCSSIFFVACDKGECYECKLSDNATEETCSNTFTPQELTNLQESCETRGGIWRMK